MACNVLGCREIYLAACPGVSPSCSITHIYTHPTHLGQAPSPVPKNVEQTSSVRLQERALSRLDSRGRCGLFRGRALKGHLVPRPMAVHAHMISGQHSSF